MGVNPATGNTITEAPKSSAGGVTRVATSTTSVQLLGANPARLAGTVIINESSGTLKIKYGATASGTDYSYPILPSGIWEMPYAYTGRIDGVLSGGTGFAQITELT
jgi:hypothetical protein